MMTMRSPRSACPANLTSMSPQSGRRSGNAKAFRPHRRISRTISPLPTLQFDRAAEIDGLGHDQNILITQTTCKAAHQAIPHQTSRAIAMRLEHHQQAAGERVQGFERGRYLWGCEQNRLPRLSHLRCPRLRVADGCRRELSRLAAAAARGTPQIFAALRAARGGLATLCSPGTFRFTSTTSPVSRAFHAERDSSRRSNRAQTLEVCLRECLDCR